MYQPAHFAETRPEELHRLIAEHPLGMLVTHGTDGLDANHLPFELDVPAGVLRAHVARANPLAALAGAAEVLVVFRGVDGYVSPNWYPSKHETHRAVPTWNYEVVHVHGRLRLMDDEKFLRRVLARLTRHHEAAEPQPWTMAEAPTDYLQDMLAQVVGIEVEVLRLEGKRKLSQNRDERDAAGVVDALRDRGHDGLATAVASSRVSGRR